MQQAVRSGRFELKKIKGTENPADLLTKHNQTHDSIEKLVALYDCYFKGGRADLAPSLRLGQSDKKTLAKAERDAKNKPILASVSAGGQPYMPHNCIDPAELDRRFPNLEAVPELQLNDLARLEDDALYAAGMEIVQQILEEMAAVGRTKKPQVCPAGPTDRSVSINHTTAIERKMSHTREVTVDAAQTNYTGINALLAVEECGDLGGYTRCQRLRAEPGGVESPQCCYRSEPRMTCLTCAARVSLVLLQPVAVT